MEAASAIGDVPTLGGLESFSGITITEAQIATAWNVGLLLGAGVLLYWGGKMIVTGRSPFAKG